MVIIRHTNTGAIPYLPVAAHTTAETTASGWAELMPPEVTLGGGGCSTSAQHLNAQGTGVTTILSPTLVLVTGKSSGGPWDPQRNNTPITNTQTARVTICNQNPVAPTPGRPELVHGDDHRVRQRKVAIGP